MTDKTELYERRREMYRLYVNKLDMSEILDILSVKYRVSKQALREDWDSRIQWVYDVFNLEPVQSA